MNVLLWQETGIGKTVNSYRKHCCETVGNFARHLVAKWKQLVQLKTGAVSDTCHVPAAHDDVLVTADVKEKVSARNCVGKVDEKHLETSSSKHVHASGNNAASKHHSSTTNKSRSHKQDGDEVMSSRACLQTKGPVPGHSGHHSDDINTSQNQCTDQSSVFSNASTEHQKLSVGDLPLVNKSIATGHKSRHEKHSTLKKCGADEKNKETYSPSKVSAESGISMSCKTKGHTAPTASVSSNVGCFATDRLLHKNGTEGSTRHGETNQSKSSGNGASKARHAAVDKLNEKKSSDGHQHSNASVSSSAVPSNAKAHSFSSISKDHDQADVNTLPSAEDVDESDYNGMTFEQMLNYDNPDIVARKKKDRVFASNKGSKGHKSASQRRAHASAAVSKQASKPDSRRRSKHASGLLHNSKSAEHDELERSQLHRQPVVPRPDNEVGIGI